MTIKKLSDVVSHIQFPTRLKPFLSLIEREAANTKKSTTAPLLSSLLLVRQREQIRALSFVFRAAAFRINKIKFGAAKSLLSGGGAVAKVNKMSFPGRYVGH